MTVEADYITARAEPHTEVNTNPGVILLVTSQHRQIRTVTPRDAGLPTPPHNAQVHI